MLRENTDRVRLEIIIPVYNEEAIISSTLDEISLRVTSLHNILIVYDFDEDNTIPVVKKYMKDKNKSNIFLMKNHYGKGVLNAIKTGLHKSQGEFILVVMGDLSDDLSIVDKMYKKLEEGYHIVCGSRYMKGGKQLGGPWFKGLLSRLAGVSLHYLTGIPTFDVTNSFKMYHKSVVNSIEIESSGGFEIGMEILVKSYLKGYKITEIPSVWKDRTEGISKFRLWKWLPKYLRWYFFAIKGRFVKARI